MNILEDFNIGIIIPNFNKAENLDECINSVINQTYKNWSLYIIDDFSNDNSLSILDKYKKHKNIRIIKLYKNKGPSFCRNLGIRISKSKYIAFLDSDDKWTSDKLEKQIKFMALKGYNFTYTDYINIYENRYPVKYSYTKVKESFSYSDFIRNSSINSSTMILSRDLLTKYKFKKLNLLEDYLFKCKILKDRNIAHKYHGHLAYYRINNKNRSINKILNILYLWNINRKFNNLSIFQNIKSVFFISYNALVKYGFKK